MPFCWSPVGGTLASTSSGRRLITEAFVLGGVRTPFARYGSSLAHIRTDDLLGMTVKGACERVGVDSGAIEDVVAGIGEVCRAGR